MLWFNSYSSIICLLNLDYKYYLLMLKYIDDVQILSQFLLKKFCSVYGWPQL